MNKTDEALANILTTLAAKFGTTVDHLYAIMIRQAFIVGVECLVAISLSGIAFIIFAIKLRRSYVKWGINKQSSYDSGWELEDAPFLSLLTITLGLVFIGLLLFGGSTAIDCFFNPEYYALHQIIKN